MIFVTGGTGMVGAHLLYDLVLKGENVRALKRPGSSLNRIGKIFSFYNPDYRSLLQKIEWVEGDILDKDGLRELLIGVDQIYHTAAIISFDSRERDLVIQNNCDGTANLVDLALSLSIPRFCHVSSIAAIGTPPEGIEASEDHPWKKPRNPFCLCRKQIHGRDGSLAGNPVRLKRSDCQPISYYWPWRLEIRKFYDLLQNQAGS